MQHRSGFVNIVGNPNVGKSTLMNALVGERLSIITSKSQTTRHRIMGIVNGEDFQIVYSDTPGVIKPAYKLQEKMMSFALLALDDADVLLYVTDVFETPDKNMDFIARVANSSAPVMLIINKVDILGERDLNSIVEQWKVRLPKAEIITASAQTGVNIGMIFDRIVAQLPESEAYYPKDQLTDKTERFFVSEIIREKILLNYDKEIPYSCEVAVDSFKESEKIVRILCTIYVARDTQKGIIIGHKGEKIKKVGIAARIDIESFLQKKVHLELFVKVSKDWRDEERSLNRFGYIDLSV